VLILTALSSARLSNFAFSSSSPLYVFFHLKVSSLPSLFLSFSAVLPVIFLSPFLKLLLPLLYLLIGPRHSSSG
jgi:hypothetical protein